MQCTSSGAQKKAQHVTCIKTLVVKITKKVSVSNLQNSLNTPKAISEVFSHFHSLRTYREGIWDVWRLKSWTSTVRLIKASGQSCTLAASYYAFLLGVIILVESDHICTF